MAEVDYTKSMIQTYEFYKVDPGNWKDSEKLTTVKSCTITRDLENETLGYCTLTGTDIYGEFYIRIYMIIIQNGFTFRECLGTYLIQTPSFEFNGKYKAYSIDAYSPLTELKEGQPDIGYTIEKGQNALDMVYRNTRDHLRAPVIKPTIGSSDVIVNDGGFVSNTDDTWLSFNIDLLSNIGRHYDITPLGEILLAPNQDAASMAYVFEYKDDGVSILYPEVSMTKDLYGIPNVVEVIYSNNNTYYRSVVKNEDPSSPTSIQNRGREISVRVVNPSGLVSANQGDADDYARGVLRNSSTIDCTITYTHGFCPVTVGDCVRIDYARANLRNIRAKVVRQIIKCTTGCSVSETAKFTMELWR